MKRREERFFPPCGWQTGDVCKYGNIGVKTDGEIKEVSALVEKPNESEKLSNYAIIGRYVLDGGIFGEIRKLKQRGAKSF